MSKAGFITGAGSGIGTAKAALKGGDPAVHEGAPMRLAFHSLLFPIAAIASVAIAAGTVTLAPGMDEFMRESDAAVSMVNAAMTASPSGEVGTDFGLCRRNEQLRRPSASTITPRSRLALRTCGLPMRVRSPAILTSSVECS